MKIKFEIISPYKKNCVYLQIFQNTSDVFGLKFNEEEYNKNIMKIVKFFFKKSVFIGSYCETIKDFYEVFLKRGEFNKFILTLNELLDSRNPLYGEIVCYRDKLPKKLQYNQNEINSVAYSIELIK